eukprot:234142-Amphidinium_carterae.1
MQGQVTLGVWQASRIASQGMPRDVYKFRHMNTGSQRERKQQNKETGIVRGAQFVRSREALLSNLRRRTPGRGNIASDEWNQQRDQPL